MPKLQESIALVSLFNFFVSLWLSLDTSTITDAITSGPDTYLPEHVGKNIWQQGLTELLYTPIQILDLKHIYLNKFLLSVLFNLI